MIGIRTCRWAACALLVAMGLGVAAQAAAQPYAGPDAFGYEANEIPYNLRDLVNTGGATELVLGDDATIAVGLPFSFSFYGNDYDAVYVGSNGLLAFGIGVATYIPTPLPSANGPHNLIAGFWDDLNPQPSFGGGTILYQTLGDPGQREFVVGFYEVLHYQNDTPVSFEMILHEGTNQIELQYDFAPSGGRTHAVGIENIDGTIGLQLAFGEVTYEEQGFLIGLPAYLEDFEIQRLEIGFRDEPDSDEFEMKGSFALSEVSDGIDLDNDDTTVSFGTVSITIPAGSFYWNHGGYEFRDTLGGANVWMTLHERQSNTFRFSIKADGVDLDGTANPTEVGVSFGVESGSTLVRSNGELKFQSDEGRHFKKRKHHYKKKKHYYGGHKDREESYQHWSGSGHR